QDNANLFWNDANKQLLLANGTAAAPSYAFANSTSTGLYRVASSTWGIAAGGTRAVSGNTSSVFIDMDSLCIRDLAGGDSGVILTGESTNNVLALRNGTNAQALHIYNTYTNASNYERIT